jgi:ketosteroid isomerase-like protein
MKTVDVCQTFNGAKRIVARKRRGPTIRFGWFIAGLLIVVPACSTTGARSAVTYPNLRASADEVEITMRARAFSAAVVRASESGWADDEVGMLSEFYTEEAVIFPPREEARRGRAAVKRYWTRSPDRKILDHVIEVERMDISGNLAADYGTLTATWKTGEQPGVQGTLTYLSVWRRDEDGIWRKHIDTWW